MMSKQCINISNFEAFPKVLQDEIQLYFQVNSEFDELTEFLSFNDKLILNKENEDIFISFKEYEKQLVKQSLNTKDLMARSLKLKINGKINIADLTCGLGKDSFYIWYFNKKIDSYERNPYIYLLVWDALRRYPLNDFIIHFGDFRDQKQVYDKIYLDPMYPQTKKTKSKAKKGMELLKDVCGEDTDEEDLLVQALDFGKQGVVLKRPMNADLLQKKDLKGQFKGKNIRYDYYFKLPEKGN